MIITVPPNPLLQMDVPIFGHLSACDRLVALEDAERLNPEGVIGYSCGAIHALEVAYRRPQVKRLVMVNPTIRHWCTAYARPMVCDTLIISGSEDDVAPQGEVFRRFMGHGALGMLGRSDVLIPKYSYLADGSRKKTSEIRLTAISIHGMNHDITEHKGGVRDAIQRYLDGG